MLRISRENQMDDLLAFVDFTNLFRKIERTIWFKGVEGQERNGEHVFQLAMIAWFIIVRFGLRLNLSLVIEYSLCHDLVETYADDTPAFPHPDRLTQPLHMDKEKREQAALERIIREWGDHFPDMVERMQVYLERTDEESRFVYALDKLVAEMNIYADDGRTNQILRVTREMSEAYKRPRTAFHPLIKQLYEELLNRSTDNTYYVKPVHRTVDQHELFALPA
jgi:5'-deoxynucleotidase YfbR-like HD superfamily hydrolase